MRILAISGSSRRDSFNTRLLQAAADCMTGSATVQWAPPLVTLPYFNEDGEASLLQDAAVATFINAVADSDALMIATPEYNQSIPGVLKNALDWLSRAGPGVGLEHTPVAVMGATVGPWGTRLAQAHLRHVLGVIGMTLVGGPLYLAHAESRHEASGQQWDEPLQMQLKRWSDEFLQAASRFHRSRDPGYGPLGQAS